MTMKPIRAGLAGAAVLGVVAASFAPPASASASAAASPVPGSPGAVWSRQCVIHLSGHDVVADVLTSASWPYAVGTVTVTVQSGVNHPVTLTTNRVTDANRGWRGQGGALPARFRRTFVAFGVRRDSGHYTLAAHDSRSSGSCSVPV